MLLIDLQPQIHQKLKWKRKSQNPKQPSIFIGKFEHKRKFPFRNNGEKINKLYHEREKLVEKLVDKIC